MGVCPNSGSGAGPETARSNVVTPQDSAIQVDFGDPTAAGDSIQNVMESVYDDLINDYRTESSRQSSEEGLRRRVSGSIPWSKKGDEGDAGEAESERKQRKEKTRRQRDELAEKEATEGTERVEAVVCRLLYNRSVDSFSQHTLTNSMFEASSVLRARMTAGTMKSWPLE